MRFKIRGFVAEITPPFLTAAQVVTINRFFGLGYV